MTELLWICCYDLNNCKALRLFENNKTCFICVIPLCDTSSSVSRTQKLTRLTFNLYWTQNISQNCFESRLISPWWLAFCDCTLSPRLLSWDKSSEKISLVHPASLHLVQNMVALDLDFTVVPTSEASAAAGWPGDEETPVRGGATGSCLDLNRDAEIVCYC